MIISEIYQKLPFDIITMTPRGTLGLCYVHIAQLMTHPAIYTTPFTLQLCYKPLGILQRVTKSQKVHISSHDVMKNLYNINFAWNRFQGFLTVGVEKQEFPLSSINVLRTIKKPFPGIWQSIHHIKWGAGRKLGFTYQEPLWIFLLI